MLGPGQAAMIFAVGLMSTNPRLRHVRSNLRRQKQENSKKQLQTADYSGAARFHYEQWRGSGFEVTEI